MSAKVVDDAVREVARLQAINAALLEINADLLVVCKALVEGEDDVPVMDLARAAIKKAEHR